MGSEVTQLVLGPAFTQDQDSPDDVPRCIGAVAEHLLADLKLAQRVSSDWSDAERGFALVDGALSRCLAQLAGTGLWGRANETPSQELWWIAGSWLEVGALQHRARFKPRGYAGDYLMLSQICDRWVCDHPLGQLFDRFFQCQAAPQAVCSRTEQIASAVLADCLASRAEPYRIASVGSGPACDVERAVSLLPEERRRDVSVVLLDLDAEALAFAERRLRALLRPDQITCLRENLSRLPKRRKSDVLPGSADFLICSGLFDYLEDEAAAALLRWFWRQLAPGGQAVVGNFAPHQPTRAYMEWIGNWYLRYRTADKFVALCDDAGIPHECRTLGAERLGIDLFLSVKKPRT